MSKHKHVWKWEPRNNRRELWKVCDCGAEQELRIVSVECRDEQHVWFWPIDEKEKDGFIWFDRICQRCGKVEHLKITLEQARTIEAFIFGT